MALDLPAVTVADRAAALLVLPAGALAGWVLGRHGLPGCGMLVSLVAFGILAARVRLWTLSRLRPALRLELCPDGSLQVRQAGETVPARLGLRTRRLGPSVFLEVEFASGGRRMRHGRWLTAWDVPAALLRRWTVVLPTCGRAACS